MIWIDIHGGSQPQKEEWLGVGVRPRKKSRSPYLEVYFDVQLEVELGHVDKVERWDGDQCRLSA